ncbi:hypothetical protein J8657_17720, partial [Dickeya oryzae]
MKRSKEIEDGVYDGNFIFPSINTDGAYFLSTANEANINAGFAYGNALLQGITGVENTTVTSLSNSYTIDLIGGPPSAISQTPAGVPVVSDNNISVALYQGGSLIVNGTGNFISSGDNTNLTVNGSDNTVVVGDGSNISVNGVPGNIFGGTNTRVNIYGDPNNPDQLTESRVNAADGTSQSTTYNTLGAGSTVTNTYSGPNETGRLTDTLTNNVDGTSSETIYSGTDDGSSVTDTFSGLGAKGTLTESLVNNPDGTSQDTVYNRLGGNWVSVVDDYSGPNDTGNLTHSLVNNADGTSQDTMYGTPGGALVSMTETYSGADGTGTLSKSVINFSDGTSTETLYSQAGNLSWTALTNNYASWNAGGALTANLIDIAPGGLGTSAYIPGGTIWNATGVQLSFNNATLTVPDSVSLPSFSANLLNGPIESNVFDTFAVSSLQNESLTLSNWMDNTDQYSLTSDIPATFGHDLEQQLTNSADSLETDQETENTSSVDGSSDDDDSDSGDGSGDNSGS